MKYWLMRAGSGGVAKDFCIQQGIIAMDWDVGDMGALPDDLEAFKGIYRKAYPMDTKGQVDQNAATNHRFVHGVQIGDWVALSNAKDQWIYLGEVSGPYYYDPASPAEVGEFRHQRRVKWQVAFPRTQFSEAFNVSLKSELTLFSLDAHADELWARLSSITPHN